LKNLLITGLLILSFLSASQISCNKDDDKPGTLQLMSIKAGSINFDLAGITEGVSSDQPIDITFNSAVDTSSAKNNIMLLLNQSAVSCKYSFVNNMKSVTLTPDEVLAASYTYSIKINGELKGAKGETYPGAEIKFKAAQGELELESIFLNGANFDIPATPKEIPTDDITFELKFSLPLDPQDYQSYIYLSNQPQLSYSLSEDQKQVTVTVAENLTSYTRYALTVSDDLKAQNGFPCKGFYKSFYTGLDSTYQFPVISDEELLELVQKQTFKYFYDFAEPNSGLSRERNTSGELVTSGGSGFGVMALIVGMERNFITRQQGLAHLGKMLDFLETCDRYHGAWAHWINGVTGQTIPFSQEDDGADLVETSYMIQGLMTMRQYLDPGNLEEQVLIGRINGLIDAVEWDWFTRGGQNVLYWHWSPNYNWAMNMKIQGYNETLIVYIMAASSTTHTIPAAAYHQGYAKNGAIINGNYYYGYRLPLGWEYGGPLFFTHYSHLGLDPRNLQDQYANYWEQGRNMSLINWAYCADNPKEYMGYSEACWGLTASDNPSGYNAHSPTNDLGTITPSAAVSALPYTPEQSMAAIRHFYYLLGDKLWGPYGFYDAFDISENWWATSYLAIDQGPIICMIENYRTGLLWDLFMSAPEVQQGLDKLGFTY